MLTTHVTFHMSLSCHDTPAAPTAGCKRPIRTFFSPLIFSAGTTSRASSSLVSYVEKLSDATLPLRCELQRVSVEHKDVGACGMWNQHEFALWLLSIAPLEHWKLWAMDGVFYESCDRMTLTSKGKELQAAREAPAAADVDVGEAATRGAKDFDVFDSCFLKPNWTEKAMHRGFHCNIHDPDHDHDNAFLDEEVSEDSAFGSDAEEVQAPPPVAASDKKRKHQDDGAAKSSRLSGPEHRQHEKATDTDLLKGILGERRASFSRYPMSDV